MPCHCGSGLEFSRCCGPILAGKTPAPTAEALMRARYSAYVEKDVAFLAASLSADARKDFDDKSARDWAARATFLQLEIVSTKAGRESDDHGEVEFVARFEDESGKEHRHHERSSFVRENGRWFFHDGQLQKEAPIVRNAPKVGRNDPCPCGSGKKYKKCCGARAA